MRTSIVLLCLGFAVVAAHPSNPQRIVGGSVTTISQYPAITALLKLIANNFRQVCGGSILNNRSVLTAAHCVVGDAPGSWRFRVGSTWASSGGVVHNTRSLIVHPNYNAWTTDNDIAVMRSASTIVYVNNAVRPASIAGSNYHLADNQVVWAAGWGMTSSGGSPSEQLRHVQIWSINQAICRSRYAGMGMQITDNMLCSGWLDVGGRDQCQQDSGGPLYHNGVVVGVASFGIGCGDPRFPGVNARVSRFTSWIQSNA